MLPFHITRKVAIRHKKRREAICFMVERMNYISDYAKGNNIEIVKVMRRNVLGQLDVNKHFDRLVQMVSEGFADGILIANMQFVSKDIDDACRKIAKVSNVGGAIYSVDDGRLAFRFKEVCRGNKSR